MGVGVGIEVLVGVGMGVEVLVSVGVGVEVCVGGGVGVATAPYTLTSLATIGTKATNKLNTTIRTIDL